ncbi:MAG: helix-turn-helix domain-containing protein [Coriobacteriia bacterium]|nr:helix-turn-helix domain-containing protein [Coriobacteriia bacterium]
MNVEIAERLAQRRREAGYSQEDLAAQLGVSRQAVSKWERSESSPDTDNLIALAKLYEVSLDDLLYVDSTIEDDVAFEAQDRAQEQNDAEATEAAEGSGTSDSEETEAEATAEAETKDGDYVNISWKDGVHVKDGDDEVHVSWKGIHVKESQTDGEEVHVGWDGVYINGKRYEGWSDFLKQYGHDHRKSVWLAFPFPIFTVIVYLGIGFFYGIWHPTWMIFLTIPLYYWIVKSLTGHKKEGA